MTFTSSIALLFVLVVVSAMASESQQSSDVIVHEGRCPSNNLLGHIHCRRRVCLPEELIPLCKSDGECATTHKCCRPMCSCQVQCVEAFHDSN